MKKYNTTLGDLFNPSQEITLNNITNLAFSRKGGLSVARNIKKINDELAEYIKERDKIILKYSSTGTINAQSPNWEEVKKELNEIGSVEVSIDLNVITEDDLPADITPAVCMAIEFMIEEE